MRIGTRLVTNAILIAVFSILATILLIGAMSYNYGKHILQEQAQDRLTLVRDMKANEIDRYFNSMKREVILFSNDPTVVAAMTELDKSFAAYARQVNATGYDKYKDEVIKHYLQEFSDDYANNNNGIAFDATPYLNAKDPSTFALQYNYIFNNPYGIDKEETLSYVNDGSDYSKVHVKYHEHLRELKQLFGLEDIFLVDPNNGDIIYTVAKGLDFTTSLINGPYANTELGAAFRAANKGDGTKGVVISEYAPYSPSNDDQAAFVATPIYDKGVKVGVLVFQLNSNTVNEIMTSDNKWEEIGLGKTGESYIVDANHRLLTSSRAFIENPDKYFIEMQKLGLTSEDVARIKAKHSTLGWQNVSSLAVDEALQGKTGFAVYKNYRGEEVLGAYQPINVTGQHWALIATIDKSEAYAPIYELSRRMAVNLIGVSLLVLVFSILVGVGLAKQISTPIEKLSVATRLLAQSQDLTRRVDYAGKDEIGDMTQALNSLLDSFQKTCQETIISTQKVQTTAHKLINLAEEIDSQESMHKFEDNYDAVHEKTDEIKTASDSLAELSARLQVLSRQFKVFEEESDRVSGW